jgi:hypothetical protein
MIETAVLDRSAAVHHGRRLKDFTIARNTLEGLVAIVAGAPSGAKALGIGPMAGNETRRGYVRLLFCKCEN